MIPDTPVQVVAGRHVAGGGDDGEQGRQGEDQTVHHHDVLWHLLILDFAGKKSLKRLNNKPKPRQIRIGFWSKILGSKCKGQKSGGKKIPQSWSKFGQKKALCPQ